MNILITGAAESKIRQLIILTILMLLGANTPVIGEVTKITGSTEHWDDVDDDNSYDHYKTSESGERLSGDLQIYTRDGVLMEEGVYKDGKPEGLHKYYRSGKLDREITYLNDERHGPFRKFYSNGNVSLEANYDHGQADGSFKRYNEDGTLSEERNYKKSIFGDQNGVPMNGIYKVLYKDGKTKEEMNLKDGKLHGPYRYYRENGNLEMTVNYKSGQLLEGVEMYDENGKFVRTAGGTGDELGVDEIVYAIDSSTDQK